MKVLIALAFLSSAVLGQHGVQKPGVGSGPFVIPLILDRDMVLNVEPFLSVEYRVSPKGEVLGVEKAEKIWFFDEVPVLILGSTGDLLPAQVCSRAMAWVRLFEGDALLGEYPIHPRRDRVQIQDGQSEMIPALRRAMVGVNATYIAQVANYLANNVSSLDVMGSTYSVDGAGLVINELGRWVGEPMCLWNYGNEYNTWTAKGTARYWEFVAMSSDGSIQTAVVKDGEVYVSTDAGETWTAKATPALFRCVAMSSDGSIQTAVSYDGYIHVSTDSGDTWNPKDSSRQWNSVAMSSDGSIQTAVVYNGQIYLSTDSGDTWTAQSGTYEPWQSVAMSSDGSIQTAVTDNTVDGEIFVSTNFGSTWTLKGPSERWNTVAMSSDGSIQAAVASGSGSGQLYVSIDSGETWLAKDSPRQWNAVAMSSDGSIQTAGVYSGQIYVSTNSGDDWTVKGM